MTEYKMLRIKKATYKELKQIALNQDCTLIALIEELLALKQSDETAYLMASPANKKELEESIAELNAGKVSRHELIDD